MSDVDKFVLGPRANARLADMFGLPADRVRQMNLVFKPDDLVTVVAEIYVDAGQLDEFSTIMDEYRLVSMEANKV